MSQKKVRPDIEQGEMWSEYRARKLSDAEYDTLRRNRTLADHQAGHKWVLEARRIKTDGGETDTGQWEIYGTGNTKAASIADMIGDTNFNEAESIDPIHSLVKEAVNRASSLRAEMQAIEDEITPHKFSKRSQLHEEFSNRYDAELRKRKWYKKAQEGKLTDEQVEQVRGPLREEYKAELAKREARIEELKKEIAAAEKATLNPPKPKRPIRKGDKAREAADVAEAERIRKSLEGPQAPGFFGGAVKDPRSDIIGGVPEEIKADDAAIESRLQRAHGVPKETLLHRIGQAGKEFWHALTRSHLNIPNTKEWHADREHFRLLPQIRNSAQDEANRDVAAIVDPLGPKQLQLFERKVVVDNLIASIDRGEPLRFGFKNRAQVEAYQDKLGKLVDATPEVKQAIDTRRKIVDDLVGELVAAKLLPEEAQARAETYYHQQVLAYWNLSRRGAGPKQTKRGFQKKRVEGVEEFGEELDYNISFIEAEFEWMRDAHAQLRLKKWLDDLAAKRDIAPQMKAEAKKEENKGKKDWRQLVRETGTHRVWDAEPGNLLYQAIGVDEQIVEDVLKGVAETAEISKGDLRKLLVLGGKKREMALPNELVDELERIAKQHQPKSAVVEVSAEILGLWKVWTLLNPLKAIPYNLRNITGDVDPVIGGAMGTVPQMPRSFKELTDYYGIARKPALSLSPDLTVARDLAVIDSSMTGEIPDIKDLEVFKRFYAGVLKNPVDAVKLYFDKVKKYSTFRENISRYAAFLYYRDALAKGTLAHYGGARKEVVDALAKEMGVDVAAAHLARNLLGDYGDLTVFGQAVRRHVSPFWSWQEINLKRYPMMLFNAAAFGPRKLGAKNPLAAPASAAAIGMVALPYILMQLYNRLFWPDEEDELSDDERASPHLIYARNDDGSIGIFRNTGAFGDFLEWFGINTAISRLDELEAGQMTAKDLAAEMASATVNKAVGGIRPEAKAAFELPTGKSIYPNVFSPRAVPRDQQAAGYFGLTDVYREAKGRVLQEGSRARPHFGQRMFGVTDPRKSALFEIMELRDRYLDKLGQDKPYRGNQYVMNMREAAAAGDQEAFTEARLAYLKNKGDYDKFRTSIANLDPIAQRMKEEDEKKFETEYLTVDQREKLGRAREYARFLEVEMWKMWREASKNDSPEIANTLRGQKLNEVKTKARALLEARPTRVTANEKEKGITLEKKRADWERDRAAAKRIIQTHVEDLGESTVLAVVNDWVRGELKDPAARGSKVRRFRALLRD